MNMVELTFQEMLFQQSIGNATTECYGVVGMASKNLVKDGLAVVLGKENYSKGVYTTRRRK